MGRALTVNQVKNMATRKLSQSVGSRGDGALLFEKRKSGNIEAYYRYKHANKEVLIKIGRFQPTKAGHGYTLAQCLTKAQELAITRRECGGDLKAHLESLQKEEEQRQLEQKRVDEAEASRGSFADLMAAYVEDQEHREKESADQTKQGFEFNILKPFPSLASKKAKDITPDDIVSILSPIHQRGAKVESVRIRALLSAAFNFGLKGDYDPTREGEKRFHISYNPVSSTRKNTNASKPGTRSLNHNEVKQLWESIEGTHRVGFVMAQAVRFMLATGGQRPKRLFEARWEDYDFQRQCVYVVNGKTGRGLPVIHAVPLTQKAMKIIESLEPLTAHYPYPFCTGVKGRKAENMGQYLPICVGSLKNVFKRYNESLAKQAEAQELPVPEWFTARDIRRTVKNLLIDAGVNREQRNLLQGHGQTGVDKKHYERHEHLPEKRESIRRYDALLEKILNGEKTTLVDMEQFRQQATSL